MCCICMDPNPRRKKIGIAPANNIISAQRKARTNCPLNSSKERHTQRERQKTNKQGKAREVTEYYY